MKKILTVLVILLGFTATCANAQTSKPSKQLNKLVSYMVGSFDSEKQSKEDTSYFNISLEMVQIWKNNNDGKWLYIEQAIAENKDAPYRQRVYHEKQINDSTFVSTVYTLSDPKSAIGVWKEKEPLSKLTPDSLILRDGCEITLVYRDGKFVGSTNGHNCPSDRKGASYAVSNVTIEESGMTSWDQGFDKDGIQVWGATKGGYHFVKKK